MGVGWEKVPVQGRMVEHLEPRRLLSTLPPGFAEERIAQGLIEPTAMAMAPDGRIFVTEKGGAVRVIENGQVLPQPLVTVPAETAGERGLLGITFDPDFAANGYMYVYYVVNWGVTPDPPHGRVSRFTVVDNQADPTSELVLASMDWARAGGIHNGGALRFGLDGKLYISTGDNASAPDSGTLVSFSGKILRINPDGSIPEDNPFYDFTWGPYRAIYARGLRNPFKMDIHPMTGRLLANDVGQVSWEEINDIVAGAHYGWPATEGDFDPQQFPSFTRPIFAYPHNGLDAAITGGAFYVPSSPSFPVEYYGDYFFADFVHNWIARLNFEDITSTGEFTVEPFATDLPSYIVDLMIGPDGALYYLSLGTGSLWRIAPSASALPSIAAHPDDMLVSSGQSVTFSVVGSGLGPLQYQWMRDGEVIDGANEPSYTLHEVDLHDDGSQFRCAVINDFGHALSDPAGLAVTLNQPPVIHILAPEPDSLYTAGDTIFFNGIAFDPEGRLLDDSAYSWRVLLHHDTHAHPFVPETPGMTSGEFEIPTTGHVEDNVWYRIHLTVTDPLGMSATTYVDILPRKATITLAADPSLTSPLNVLLDGMVLPTPHTFVGVAGILRLVEAPTEQVLAGQTYVFQQWSDGVTDAQRMLVTPGADLLLTAEYLDITPPQLLGVTFSFEPIIPGDLPHRVRYVFSEDVSASILAAQQAFGVFRAGDHWEVLVEAMEIEWITGEHVATVRFPGLANGILPDGEYVILPLGPIVDATGNPLASPSPVLEFFVLAGDANRDRRVDLTDFSILAANFNLTRSFSQGDFDYNGTVGIEDFAILAGRFNKSVAFSRAPLPAPVRVSGPAWERARLDLDDPSPEALGAGGI